MKTFTVTQGRLTGFFGRTKEIEVTYEEYEVPPEHLLHFAELCDAPANHVSSAKLWLFISELFPDMKGRGWKVVWKAALLPTIRRRTPANP